MSADRLKKLLDVADPQDRDELEVAHSAMVSALNAHGAAPTAATVINKNAAREDYESTVARLGEKYFPGEIKDHGGERFSNRKQALNWLQAQGYKVSQGKFYQDVEAGFPALYRDGTVSKYQVMQYGQQIDITSRLAAPEKGSAEREQLELRKLRADVEVAEMKARKEDARWMLVDDGWAAVAALLSTLKDNIRHHLHEGQSTLVHVADGDPARESEVFEAAVEMVGKAFDELAGARIEGIFSPEGNVEEEMHEQ